MDILNLVLPFFLLLFILINKLGFLPVELQIVIAILTVWYVPIKQCFGSACILYGSGSSSEENVKDFFKRCTVAVKLTGLRTVPTVFERARN